MIETKRKEQKLFEQRIAECFEREAAERKELERRFMQTIEDKTNSVKGELAKEAAMREEGVENLKSCLEVYIFIMKQYFFRMIFRNCKIL